MMLRVTVSGRICRSALGLIQDLLPHVTRVTCVQDVNVRPGLGGAGAESD